MRVFGKKLNRSRQHISVLAMLIAVLALLFVTATDGADAIAVSGPVAELTEADTASQPPVRKPCHPHYNKPGALKTAKAAHVSHHAHSPFSAGLEADPKGDHWGGDLCCEDEDAPIDQQTAFRLPRELVIGAATLRELPFGGLGTADVDGPFAGFWGRSGPPIVLSQPYHSPIFGPLSIAALQFSNTVRLLI